MPRTRRKDKIAQHAAHLDMLLGKALQSLRTARAERNRALSAATDLYNAARDEINWALGRAPLEMRAWRKAGLAHRVWWALTGRIPVKER